MAKSIAKKGHHAQPARIFEFFLVTFAPGCRLSCSSPIWMIVWALSLQLLTFTRYWAIIVAVLVKVGIMSGPSQRRPAFHDMIKNQNYL
jgi:hypothetical protein